MDRRAPTSPADQPGDPLGQIICWYAGRGLSDPDADTYQDEVAEAEASLARTLDLRSLYGMADPARLGGLAGSVDPDPWLLPLLDPVKVGARLRLVAAGDPAGVGAFVAEAVTHAHYASPRGTAALGWDFIGAAVRVVADLFSFSEDEPLSAVHLAGLAAALPLGAAAGEAPPGALPDPAGLGSPQSAFPPACRPALRHGTRTRGGR